MSVSLDASEVASLAKHLRRAAPRLAPELEAILDRRAHAAVTEARATALADAVEPRPWLGTPEGIVVRRGRLVRTIVSPRDPEGQSVGYRIEYGTSVMAPRPFLGPAVRAQRDGLNRDALAALVRVSL